MNKNNRTIERDSFSKPKTLRSYDASSSVEEVEWRKSGRKPIYSPVEKIRVIEVPNFPTLGKLTALRFLESVLKNPDGVISLPTGKTPEHFIKWVNYFLDGWEQPDVRRILDEYAIESSHKPDFRELHFVQIDEFYPIDAKQHNSFYWYVNEFYIKGFGLDPQKALLIDATRLGLPDGKTMEEVFPDLAVDLTLRVRQARSDHERLQREVINRVDEFCMDYESKIRAKGGIGFFLGGIGPDGHIAFNVRGSSFYSVTRLTATNYETQAAAATDLGGIEISRNRLVITIGLGTIVYNPTVTAIIIAAGDAKAGVVAQAIQNHKSPQYPASILHEIPNARFYLTKGAASQLQERIYEDFCKITTPSEEEIDDVVVSLALAKDKELLKLTRRDFEEDRRGAILLRKTGASPERLCEEARDRMVGKINRGVQTVSKMVFLHTEPHHDDIMLGYMPYIYHLVRDPSNRHYFGNLTSGFTAVSNSYFLSVLQKLERWLQTKQFVALLQQGYFDPSDRSRRMEDVYLFLDGSAADSPEMKAEAEARRMLRNFVETFKTTDLSEIYKQLSDIVQYLQRQYPGAKDPPIIQTMKGSLREWEVELLWAHVGIESDSVSALRLGFYTGDIFSEEPRVDRDVPPILALMKKVEPDVVTATFDPEGSGPDTHYKALQAIAEALRIYLTESNHRPIRVWGYRNVWYRFRPAECNIMVPLSLNSLAMVHSAFMNCFGSQRAASFPNYEHDGPFSELAQKIQVEQYRALKTCLGKEYFLNNEHLRLRAARAMIFLKEMDLPTFFEHVRVLKERTEQWS